jgi:4-amino-4-deoxychorismate mutase
MDKLAKYRAELNTIDEQIIALLGQRYAICRNVARHKKEQHIPMMQHGRVNEVKDRCAKLAIAQNINPDCVRNLYSLIIDEACKIEDAIINNSDNEGGINS